MKYISYINWWGKQKNKTTKALIPLTKANFRVEDIVPICLFLSGCKIKWLWKKIKIKIKTVLFKRVVNSSLDLNILFDIHYWSGSLKNESIKSSCFCICLHVFSHIIFPYSRVCQNFQFFSKKLKSDCCRMILILLQTVL